MTKAWRYVPASLALAAVLTAGEATAQKPYSHNFQQMTNGMDVFFANPGLWPSGGTGVSGQALRRCYTPNMAWGGTSGGVIGNGIDSGGSRTSWGLVWAATSIPSGLLEIGDMGVAQASDADASSDICLTPYMGVGDYALVWNTGPFALNVGATVGTFFAISVGVDDGAGRGVQVPATTASGLASWVIFEVQDITNTGSQTYWLFSNDESADDAPGTGDGVSENDPGFGQAVWGFAGINVSSHTRMIDLVGGFVSIFYGNNEWGGYVGWDDPTIWTGVLGADLDGDGIADLDWGNGGRSWSVTGTVPDSVAVRVTDKGTGGLINFGGAGQDPSTLGLAAPALLWSATGDGTAGAGTFGLEGLPIIGNPMASGNGLIPIMLDGVTLGFMANPLLLLGSLHAPAFDPILDGASDMGTEGGLGGIGTEGVSTIPDPALGLSAVPLPPDPSLAGVQFYLGSMGFELTVLGATPTSISLGGTCWLN